MGNPSEKIIALFQDCYETLLGIFEWSIISNKLV